MTMAKLCSWWWIYRKYGTSLCLAHFLRVITLMTFTKDETLYPDEIFYVIMSSAIAEKVLKQTQELNIERGDAGRVLVPFGN